MPPNPPAIPDQSHINVVRDALSVSPLSRASLMVGAGFSRNAEKTRFDVGELPLWSDIGRALFNSLYPEKAYEGTEGAALEAISADNALRRAEEYTTAFGRSALYDLLGRLVRDNDYVPGVTHKRLLRLPWRDVFTTNWDTLLERASSEVPESSYRLVQDMKQLPLVSQPRIIKLNGSFPSQFPLIFTEEDYRTYPTKFAPFVNTVQQAMMETVFFLIGFSGDDPNFLKWSGWIRDNLGEAAPKIYLAGWLELSRHQRRMLESRNVMPIDLAEHPQAESWYSERRHHQSAAEWLLYSLELGQAYDWTTWPKPPEQDEIAVPEHLEPVERIVARLPQEEPDGW